MVDPSNAANVTVINQGGPFVWSTNGTAAAASVSFSGTTGFDLSGVPNVSNPTDVPWFGVGGTGLSQFFSIGPAIFDPSVSNKIWVGGGIGNYYTTTTSSYVFYTSQSVGLAELISNDICSPPGYFPLWTCWDRPLWRITAPSVYPSAYQPNYPTTAGGASEPVTGGWSCEWASFAPSYQVAVCNGLNNGNDDTCYSTDGGATWQTYRVAKTFPNVAKVGGCISAATATNIIMIFSNNGDVYNTKDGGTTWNLISAANFQTLGGGATGMQNAGSGITTGWGGAYFNVNRRAASDRVTADTFYAYNNQTSGNGGGFYFTSNKGDLWKRMISGSLGSQTENEKLITVPNLTGSISTAGHFFYTDGRHGTGLWCSFSGTATSAMIAVNGVGEVYNFNFGAVKSGNDYPSVYMIGFVGGTYGIYRSDSSSSAWAAAATPGSVTWNLLTIAPNNSTDVMNAICGDSNTYGTFYLGGGNQAYYSSLDATTPVFGFSVITDSGQRKTKMIGY